jgi:hypothetical protein
METWIMRSLILSTFTVLFVALGSASAQDKKPITTVIDVAVESSLFDKTKGVLKITNKSDAEIKGLVVDTHNKDSNRKGTYTAKSIKAGKKQDVGMNQIGFTLLPNDEVTITLEGYTTEKWLITKTDDGRPGIKKLAEEKKSEEKK